jgi:hypothetical protein
MVQNLNQTPESTQPKKSKKGLIWGLTIFIVILLATAGVLLWQMRQPTAPLPSPRPKPSPSLPPVEQLEGEMVCETSFTIPGLACSEVSLDPAGQAIQPGEQRDLTAVVTGGSGTYAHAWSVSTDGTTKGSLSSLTNNPVSWTAPTSLSATQSWTITDTITDSSVDPALNAECSVELAYSQTSLSGCYETCVSNSDCETGLECAQISGQYVCVNPDCEEETDCTCPGEKLACFVKCTEDSQCETGLYCMTVPGTTDKRCVNKDCQTEEDCTCEAVTVACFGQCTSDADCAGTQKCRTFPGTSQLRCLNPNCTSETDCVCPTAEATPTPSPTPPTELAQASPSPRVAQPELPEAGVSLPAILGVSAGVLLIVLGLLF